MRIVIDEDIPSELTPLFRGPGLEIQHVEEIGLAVVLIHTRRLVVDQIKPLIPLAVAAFPAAPKHAVTVVGALD